LGNNEEERNTYDSLIKEKETKENEENKNTYAKKETKKER